MKTKKLLSILLLLSVCVATALNVYNQSQTPQYSDLTIANIEAMAGDDGGEEGLGSTKGTARGFNCGIRVGFFQIECDERITVCMGDNEEPCSGSTCDRHEK